MRVDFHSHILPGIDDGSKSVEESIQMLCELKKQGIDTVVATPHFYIEQNEVEEFIQKRDKSLALLTEAIKDRDDVPHIIPGAEVLFYNELYMLDGLDRLCIGDTPYILIEMPFSKWDKTVFDRLLRTVLNNNVRPVIAHIDRYLNKNNKKYLNQFGETDAILQINADAFYGSFWARRQAFGLIKKGYVGLVGSDCHNMTSRPPKIKKAYDLIHKKLGHAATSFIDGLSEEILCEKQQRRG